MEVCGGHTAAIYRFGLHHLLHQNIKLLSGPGCPVCVTPVSYVDHAIALSEKEGIVLASFGDLLRVPGTRGSLSDARASGAHILICYSSATALDYAIQHPDCTVIFLGIGFETTACTIAATLCRAIDTNVKNFRVMSAMKTMPAALNALLSSPETSVDGLILPGHVSTITGTAPFDFIATQLNIPCAVSGFEPVDILNSVADIAEQKCDGRAEVRNCYRRAVETNGNSCAQQAMRRVLEPCAATWRGLGRIPDSGLKIQEQYSEWDAAEIQVAAVESMEHHGCRCGDVLRGSIHPKECRLFGKGCTPDHPVGACMVSSEGACAAVFNFHTDYAD